MWAAILALAASSVLNALYYIPAVFAIWQKPSGDVHEDKEKNPGFVLAAAVLMMGVVLLGTCAGYVTEVIKLGLSML